MPTYKKQDNQQSNDWGYASTINRTIDNIDAIVGGEQLKESVNSVSTRVDKLNNALDNTLVGINQTLQETQTAVQNTIAEYVKKMESLKTDTEADVNTVIQAINKVKDTTGDKANLYQYFNDDTSNERRNLVQTANKMLEMIGYNSQTNRSIEDLTTNDKSSIVKAVNELDSDIGDTTTLTTTNKGNVVGAINEVDKEYKAADKNLQSNIDIEAKNRQDKDNELKNLITDETKARIDKDTELEGKITTNETEIKTKQNKLIAGDGVKIDTTTNNISVQLKKSNEGLTDSDTDIPSSKLVKDELDKKLDSSILVIYDTGIQIFQRALVIYNNGLYISKIKISNTTNWEADKSNMEFIGGQQ